MLTDILKTSLWTAIGYLSGSFMFSAWLVRLFVKKDVREFGDGNPGATNAWKAGGWKIGIPAALLDYLKGAVPVGLAWLRVGITGWGIVPIALAPVLGHAFSPFLKFKGGNAVAVAFGIWTGITLWEGPTMLGILFGLLFAILDADGWTVIFTMLAFLGYWILRRGPDYVLISVWAGNMLIFLIKYVPSLRTQRIKLRPYILKLFRGGR